MQSDPAGTRRRRELRRRITEAGYTYTSDAQMERLVAAMDEAATLPAIPRPAGGTYALDDPVAAVAWWCTKLDKPRFVYFIQEPDDGPVKIGEAFDPPGRLRELQCGNPRELMLKAIVLATDQTERWLHIFWQEARIRGEWFEDDSLVAIALHAQREQMNAWRPNAGYVIAQMATSLIRPHFARAIA